MGLPSLSLFREVTRPFIRVPPCGTEICVEVVVPHLWGHLKVTVVRVKVIVVIIEVIVRGQVFCRKILFRGIGSKVVSNSLIEYPAHFLVDRAVDLLVVQMPQG
jgi:hypothetical protein